MPNVLSPRDLVFRPDNMDETVPHKNYFSLNSYTGDCQMHLFCDFLGPKMKSVILKQACGGVFQKIGNQ